MNKIAIAILGLTVALGGMLPHTAAAGVGRAREIIKMPANVQGTMTLRIYSLTQQRYIQTVKNVRNTDAYDFTIPAWDQWYWIGVWRDSDGELVLSMWINHIRTN